MKKPLSQLEESIIESINTQAINLSKHDALHYNNVKECYLAILEIQALALAGKFDMSKVIEVLIKIKTIK